MHDPKNITETTTLAELRAQCVLLDVIALRIYPSLEGTIVHLTVEEPRRVQEDHPELLDASAPHATGFYVGTGPTEATAIEAAFAKRRRALLPEPLKEYLKED